MTNKELLAKVTKLEKRIEELEGLVNAFETRFAIEALEAEGKKVKYIDINNTIYSVDENELKKQAKAMKNNIAKTETTETVKSKSTKTPVVVGNLIFDGKYVKTGTDFMNSKTRYAIMKSITEKFGGVKLTKGNPVFDKCHKEDKYVQVYEFKTVADCKKFMAEQQKRVG